MTLPQHVEDAVRRLELSLAPMLALRSEVGVVRASIERSDYPGAYLVLRMIAESMLRHACRERGIKPGGGSLATLDQLKQSLRKPDAPPTPEYPPVHLAPAPQEGAAPSEENEVFDRAFWSNLRLVQEHANRRAHSSVTDVYAATLHRAEEIEHINVVMHALCAMVPEFLRRFPPRSMPPAEQAIDGLLPNSPDEQPALPLLGAGGSSDPVDESPDDELEEEPEEVPDESDETPVLTHEAQVYADLTAARALQHDEARSWLASATALGARRVTRRLKGVHGSTKLKNLFPEAFPQFGGVEALNGSASQEQPEPSLDYAAIGQLTLRRARDLELSSAIARLTGQSPSEVHAALTQNHGKYLVSNVFSWYDIDTLRDLSVATALRFGLVRVLASHLGRQAGRVLEQLRAHHGRTALKTVFPELG